MGQKIHPTGFRLAVTRNWGSRWYAGNSNFASMLEEDLKVRDYLKKKLKNASVGRVLIERPAKNARITIFSSRPGVVIGKKGEDIEVLKSSLAKMMGVPVHVNIEEIRKPEVDAQLIADLKKALPDLEHLSWEPAVGDSALTAAKTSFGVPVEVRPRLEKAKLILALGHDFLIHADRTLHGLERAGAQHRTGPTHQARQARDGPRLERPLERQPRLNPDAAALAAASVLTS
mgnify:CR=1 FL=1